VLDAFSRRIVGWAMEAHLRTELVLAALEMAIGQREPRNVIHHTDRGTQYTSLAFGGRCPEAGVRPFMGSVGDAYDNAMCESFFATLECELLARRRFTSQTEARMVVFSYIEGWYDPARRHSGVHYFSPIAHERQMLKETQNDLSNKPSAKPGQLQGRTPASGNLNGANANCALIFGLSAFDPSVLRLRQPRQRLEGWYAQHTASHSRFGDRFTRRSSALHPCRARPPTHTHYAGASCACNRTERGEEERRVGDISDAARAGPGTSSTPTWCCGIKA